LFPVGKLSLLAACLFSVLILASFAFFLLPVLSWLGSFGFLSPSFMVYFPVVLAWWCFALAALPVMNFMGEGNFVRFLLARSGFVCSLLQTKET
jgi:hypothetical protein